MNLLQSPSWMFSFRTITLPPPCFIAGMVAYTFQNVQSLSCQPKEGSHTNLLDLWCSHTELYVLFAQWLSPWNSAMQSMFGPYLSDGGAMNSDLTWGQWALRVFGRCCGVFGTSWMSRCWAVFVGRLLFFRFQHDVHLFRIFWSTLLFRVGLFQVVSWFRTGVSAVRPGCGPRY